jgi:hypothetical protein
MADGAESASAMAAARNVAPSESTAMEPTESHSAPQTESNEEQQIQPASISTKKKRQHIARSWTVIKEIDKSGLTQDEITDQITDVAKEQI